MPSGQLDTTTEPKSCPHCGSRDLREAAQTQYITYLSCGQCRYLVTLSVLERGEHFRVQSVHGRDQAVLAGPAFPVRDAAVEVGAPRAVVTGVRGESAAAERTAREP